MSSKKRSATAKTRSKTTAKSKGARKSTSKARSTKKSSRARASHDLSIEETWKYVDRFCRALWDRHMSDETPASLAQVIVALRDGERVPPHEANMMHTIRSLRNTVVHETHGFGEHETVVARAAWEIVRQWGEKKEKTAWRAAVKACE